MKKVLALIVAVVMVLALTAVFASAEYALPTEWDGEALDWSYLSNSVMQATVGSPMWLQLVWGIDYNVPEWAWTQLGMAGAPDVSTWYGTDGTDGALSSLQAMEDGSIYQLQFSYCIWDIIADIDATIEGYTNAQKAAATDEIGYYEFLKAHCVEAMGNLNGVNSEGVSGDKSQPAMLHMPDMLRASKEAIAAAASNPGTSDMVNVVAIFAGISVLAAAAVVLKKKVA